MSIKITPREHQVLELATQGLAFKAIADRLGIAHGTVRIHTSRLYKKLKARNMAHAVYNYYVSEPPRPEPARCVLECLLEKLRTE